MPEFLVSKKGARPHLGPITEGYHPGVRYYAAFVSIRRVWSYNQALVYAHTRHSYRSTWQWQLVRPLTAHIRAY